MVGVRNYKLKFGGWRDEYELHVVVCGPLPTTQDHLLGRVERGVRSRIARERGSGREREREH